MVKAIYLLAGNVAVLKAARDTARISIAPISLTDFKAIHKEI